MKKETIQDVKIKSERKLGKNLLKKFKMTVKQQLAI